MPSVAVVTDSTSYLPVGLDDAAGVVVVPLQVVMGAEPHDETAGLSGRSVADALREWTPVSTSRPAPGVFMEAYEKAAADGADAVVSVHLSGAMSGTVESAALAARDAPVPVTVVDSRQLGMGLGFAVLAAARAARAGADAATVAAAAEGMAAATTSLFYVDTLEYLRRGGRIGAAQALLGSALAVKPLLHVVDGRIAPLDRVRTSSRALARLQELALQAAGDRPVDVAVHHLAAAARAQDLATALQSRLPALRNLYVSEVGAVVGVHVGPGMVAVVVAPAE